MRTLYVTSSEKLRRSPRQAQKQLPVTSPYTEIAQQLLHEMLRLRCNHAQGVGMPSDAAPGRPRRPCRGRVERPASHGCSGRMRNLGAEVGSMLGVGADRDPEP